MALAFVSASVNVYTTAAGCPCEVRIDLHDEFGSDVTPYFVVDLPAIPAGDNDTDEVVSIQGWVSVPTGVNRTYSVVANRTLGTARLLPYGRLTAMYFPFDGTGSHPGAASVESATSEERGH